MDTPDIRDVNVEEGQALTFTASFDTLPAFEPANRINAWGTYLRMEQETLDAGRQ